MHKSLSRLGYILEKEKLDKSEISSIKKDLTVKPIVIQAFADFQKDVKAYPIYLESPKRLFLPRFYGIEKYGEPQRYLLKDGKTISVQDNITLMDHQLKAFDITLNHLKTLGGGVLSLPCGYGKCVAKNTPIMLYSGKFKMSQDIKPGDQLMGDDSTPRNVLSTCTGREMLYKVVPDKGDSYIVNESHILSLTFSSECTYKKTKYKKGDVIDMPLKEFINLSPLWRTEYLRGYRVPVKFPHKPVDFDPYLLGHWLGNGHSNDKTHQFLQKHNLVENKHIPDLYKYNSRDIQLKVLAGILDSHGYMTGNIYDLVLENEKLMNDVIFLCRSLGFACYKKECKNPCTDATYFRITISGEELPLKIAYKKVPPRKQIKNVLTTRIRVEKLEVGDYYGFTIDGNRRFLLGDFQVTHNTVLALKIFATLKLKTIVVVNKEFLMDQWVERIQQFLPDARIGIIQQKKLQVEDKDIVIGMIHSISLKDYPKEVFQDFGLAIVDETHHASAKMFSKALPKISCQYQLGLSATPNRRDGLSYVFYHYLGPLFHSERRVGKNKVIIKQVKIRSEAPNYDVIYKTIRGKQYKNSQAMIGQLVTFNERNMMIIQMIKELIKQGRTILILSDRREHLEYFNDTLIPNASIRTRENKFATYGLYYGKAPGTNKKDHQKSLEATSKCDIVLGTCAMASEALDIPSLNTLIFVTPMTDVEQASGRILRKFHKDVNPMIIDIIDLFGNFEKHGKDREKYFRSEDYIIQTLRINLSSCQEKNVKDLEKLTEYINDTEIDPKILKQEIFDDVSSPQNQTAKKIQTATKIPKKTNGVQKIYSKSLNKVITIEPKPLQKSKHYPETNKGGVCLL